MTNQAQVDFQTAAVASMAEEWPLIDALIGGTSAMRKAGKQFLPKFPAEEEDAYQARLKASTLFPAFTHTAVVMTAKPFSRPMTVDTKSTRVDELLKDVDQLGTDLTPFAAGVFLKVMQYGLHGVLVDVPERKDGLRTQADERQAGIRPYFAHYPCKTIRGWRTKRTEKGFELTLLRLFETVIEEDGEWGEKEVEQVRVLRPGAWAIYRKVDRSDGTGMIWRVHKSGRTPGMARIPFVFFYGIREKHTVGVGKAPLLEIAHMNHEHWCSASDQRNILHVARVPILFASGVSASDDIIVGAQQAARATDPNAKLQYVEHTGAAIDAGRQDLLDIEERMRKAGAELLVMRPSVETATQIKTESEGGKSILQMIAEDFEESLEQAVALMGEWRGEKIEPEIELFKEFADDGIDAQGTGLVLQAAKDGHVSSETVHETLKRGGQLPTDADWKAEQARIAAQPKQPEPKQPAPSGA